MFAALCRCLLLLALGVGLLPAAAQTPAPGAAPNTPAPAVVSTAPAALAPEGAPRPRPARAAARPAEPQGTCLVAEFRTMALTTHDGIERARKASEWLTKNSGACTFPQLAMINANRASWLGTADTVQLMGQVDGIIESKATSSPELMAALYGTKPEPARKSNDTTSASAQSTTPRQTVVPPAPAAPVAAVVVPAVQPGAPGVRPPGPVAQPSAAAPGVTPPAAAAPKPAEIQKFFNTRLRDSVRQHFTQSRGPDVCPPGTILREMRCEAIIAARKWKLGEPVAADLPIKDVAPTLLERLGAPPAGHRFVQVGVDVLLLSEDMRVVDAVLDLGQVPPVLPTPKKA